MKTLIHSILLFALLLVMQNTVAQTLQSNFINYQGIARDASGDLLADQSITLDIELRFGSPNIAASYSETHTVTTDAGGVFNIKIGDGTATLGNYNDLNWGSLGSYVNVSLNGTEIGTTEINAVPFALSSADQKWFSESGSNDIFYNGGAVGIGISDPEFDTHIAGDLFVQSNLGAFHIGFPNNGNRWRVSTTNSGADLLFRSKPDGNSAYDTRFAFNQGGELQSGTTGTPNAWLQIQQNSNINKQHILLEEVGNDYARIGFKNTVSDGNWDIAGYPSSNASNARFNVFYRNSSSGGGVDRLIITGDGEIGINGTPTARLELFQGGQSVGTGLRFDDGTANQDWDITHGFGLRFHYGGNLRAAISATNGAYIQGSDKRLKKNIETLPSVLDKVSQLQPSTYTYIDSKDKTRSIGLVAQDVKPLFPELVHYSEADDLYGIDYAAFSVIALKAIQEQQQLIERLKARIEILESK